MTIEQLNIKIQNFDVEYEVDKILIKNESEILDDNKSQLFAGEDAFGVSLGEYSPVTIEYKKERGQPFDRITLKDEGDFYRGFKIDTELKEISSIDYKTEKLVVDFGENIFGLNEKNMNKLIDTRLTPELFTAIQGILK